MIGETAVAAVAKIRADLVNVTSGDFGAAQSAMSLCARSAIVDNYEAEHVGPPPDTRSLVMRRDFIVTLC
jgi:hypothetical protein